MTDKIATRLKARMTELSIVPFADGRFEVFVDGDLMYSKLADGVFPDEAQLVSDISARA